MWIATLDSKVRQCAGQFSKAVKRGPLEMQFKIYTGKPLSIFSTCNNPSHMETFYLFPVVKFRVDSLL